MNSEFGLGPISERQVRSGAGPHGALFIRAPETLTQKIAAMVKHVQLNRFQLKYSVEDLPHEQSLRTIELYATEVIPRVKELLAE